jgi:undecaprenyl-diphosphatase
MFAGLMLLVTAAALFSVRRINPPDDTGARPRISWKVALFVGLAQGIAILPGISRSGFTIVSGLWGGMGRNSAAEFSFLLSVPTIAAASVVELALEYAEAGELATGDPQGILIAGMVAFVSGLIAIHWLMRWLRRGRLWWFSGYCGILGVLAVTAFGFNLI